MAGIQDEVPWTSGVDDNTTGLAARNFAAEEAMGAGGGTPGDTGWSPVLSVITDTTRRVLQVSDWTGGTGSKPATGQYVSASGLTSTLASAIDIRGATGATGDTGATGAAGATTVAGATDVTLASLADGDALIYDSATSKFKNKAGVQIIDSNGHLSESVLPLRPRSLALVRRSTAVAETISRRGAAFSGLAISTQRIYFTAIAMIKGQVVNNATFCSGGTAMVSGSNHWACLYSSAGAKLIVSNDQTSTAWAANTEKTFTFSTPYTVTADDYFYLGLMVNATTVPTIMGAATNSVVTALGPRIAGVDLSSGWTTPSTAPATITWTASPSELYGWVA